MAKLSAPFKMRKCMNPNCNAKILSTWNGHRFCEKCRKREESPGDDVHKVHY